MARKILLADDSVTAQNMGRKILADAGYEVITVNNGSAALKKIGEIRPDLIVLDVYMPGYSGLEVCQRLKEAGDTARIPILLTVGKLEPFKPEEARRVRAEGFIVKPFEASELLSALTKLEDKMLPRGESSKPGRFARTIAAVEEGRYDKTMASDEDSGWKNRIAFPPKKKEKAAEKEDQDDSAIYNPVNKDLRTVLEPKSAPVHPAKVQEPKVHELKAQEIKTEARKDEARVDLGALAPEGLPKDVTPEEIAALAAAAAQMQGKIAETKVAEAKSAETKSAEAKSAETEIGRTEIGRTEIGTKVSEAKIAEFKVSEPIAEPASAASPAIASETAHGSEKVASADAGDKVSEVVQAKEPHPAYDAGSSQPTASASSAAEETRKVDEPVSHETKLGEAKFEETKLAQSPAETKSAESKFAEATPAEAKPDAAFEAVASSASLAVPNATDFTTAISALENFSSTEPSTRRSGQDADEHSESAPATMAMGAAASSGGTTSRWRAVAVQVAPEESALALEDEMRQAFAAYAAPVDQSPEPVSHPVEPKAEEHSAASSEAVGTFPSAGDVQIPAPATPEIAQTGNFMPDAAIESLRSPVKSFEMVSAAKPEPEAIPSPSAPSDSTLSAHSGSENSGSRDSRSEDSRSEDSESPFARAIEKAVTESSSVEANYEEARREEIPVAQATAPETAETFSSSPSLSSSQDGSSLHDESPTRPEPPTYETPIQANAAAPEQESSTPISVPASSVEEREVFSTPVPETSPAALSADSVAAAETASQQEAVSAKRSSASNGESDIAATTAAAWASWRRIRESGDSRHPADSSEKGSEVNPELNPEVNEDRAEAAMAVAAGAEKAPEESPELASIVDSVLADLRPKIVEEISKKLKKKS